MGLGKTRSLIPESIRHMTRQDIESLSEKIVYRSITEFIEEKNLLKNNGKIAILVSVLSDFQGAGKVAKGQAIELSRKHPVALFTFENHIGPIKNISIYDLTKKDNRFPNLPIPTIISRGIFLINIFGGLKIAKELKNYDIIIVHQTNLAPLAYLSKILYNNCTIFYNHHPYTPLNLEGIYGKIISVIIDPILFNFVKRLNFIISVSKFSNEKLREKYKLNGHIIYNSIESNKFNENLNKMYIRDKFNIKSNKMVLFVGRLVPYKGVHLLIRSFERLINHFPNSKLVVVGDRCDKNYFKHLKELCLHMPNSVIFVGTVPDEELPFYYAACDIYATCSLWEGFNIPLLEAQSCGKPVVAFDIGPHKELVKNGLLAEEGNIEDFCNKLEELLSRSI